MTALKNFGLAAGTAAMAVGVASGAAPASAAPTSTPGHNLYVFPHPADPSRYIVTVKGVYPMDEYSAHGYINNLGTGKFQGGIDYYVHADDPDGNDPTISTGLWFPGAGSHPGGYLKAESDGIHYLQEISLPKSALNEDDGVFDDTDEVYAYVRFVDGDGGVRRAYTHPVTGTF